MAQQATGLHPILACVRDLSESLKTVGDVNPTFMDVGEKQAALVELSRVIDQVAELRCRVLACAEDVADAASARDAGEWLGRQTRSGRAARRDLHLARGLERWPTVAAAVRDARVNLAQAHVILQALDALPDTVSAQVRDHAAGHLIDAAGTYGPEQLRILGRKILDVVDPVAAEDREAQALADEEEAARQKTFLRWRRNGDGTVDFRGRVSDAVWARLLTYLHAYTSPRQPHPQPGAGDPEGPARPAGPVRPAGPAEDHRPYDQRMGTAFGSFLETTDPTRLPLHGGDATTVVITIDLDTLRSDLDRVGLIGDEPITPGQARRLACTAGLLPAVLDGDSQVLDLGRTRRLATPAQRKALALKHPHCQADGCDIPAPWCEAHHQHPWATGGHTNLDDLALLCTFHHHRTHDPHWRAESRPDGRVTFHRRT